MSNIPTQEELEAAGLADFRNVVRLIWKHLGLPDPTPLQLSIARTLQHGDRRLMIQAFRGVGKSWLTAAFVIFNWLQDPQRRILVISASQPLADSFSNFVKSLVNSIPEFEHLRQTPDTIRTSVVAWDVGPAGSDPAPSMKSAGITGQITGSRADIIIFDDIEVPKNSLTHLMRQRLSELIKEAAAILKPLPTSRIIYLGTPQTEESVYRNLPERGYAVRIWPSEIPEHPERYGKNLAPFVQRMIEAGAEVGTPTEPGRFSKSTLAEAFMEYKAAGYALQFLLDTSPSDRDRHPLRLRDLMVYDCDPVVTPATFVWGNDKRNILEDLGSPGFDGDFFYSPMFFSKDTLVPYSGTVMAIDPSGSGKDETAYAIVRILHGNLFLVASGGFLDGFSDATLDGLAKVAKLHNVNYVITETNFGGGMFAKLLQPFLVKHKAGSLDLEYKAFSQGQKEVRIIDSLQPVMNQHKLIVSRQVVEQDLLCEDHHYSLFWQMSRLTKDRGSLPHDDRLDALQMAVAYWTERMAQDDIRGLLELRDAQRNQSNQEWLDGTFLTNLLGKAPKEDLNPTWHRGRKV